MVGILIGIVVGIACIVGLVVCCYKRRNAKKRKRRQKRLAEVKIAQRRFKPPIDLRGRDSDAFQHKMPIAPEYSDTENSCDSHAAESDSKASLKRGPSLSPAESNTRSNSNVGSFCRENLIVDPERTGTANSSSGSSCVPQPRGASAPRKASDIDDEIRMPSREAKKSTSTSNVHMDVTPSCRATDLMDVATDSSAHRKTTTTSSFSGYIRPDYGMVASQSSTSFLDKGDAAASGSVGSEDNTKRSVMLRKSFENTNTSVQQQRRRMHGGGGGHTPNYSDDDDASEHHHHRNVASSYSRDTRVDWSACEDPFFESKRSHPDEHLKHSHHLSVDNGYSSRHRSKSSHIDRVHTSSFSGYITPSYGTTTRGTGAAADSAATVAVAPRENHPHRKSRRSTRSSSTHTHAQVERSQTYRHSRERTRLRQDRSRSLSRTAMRESRNLQASRKRDKIISL